MRALKDDLRAGSQLLARMHESFPLGACGAADEQALDGSAARYTPAEKPCRKDARVVDDEDIAPLEKLGKGRDGFVDHGPDCAIEEEHARGAPLRCRLLRDQFRRKIEIEIADIHVRGRV